MGIPSGLIVAQSDGTREREGWRRAAHGAFLPVLRTVTREIRDKLRLDNVKVDLSSLYASDLVGRSNSFKRLVEGGRSVEDAAKLTGLLGMES